MTNLNVRNKGVRKGLFKRIGAGVIANASTAINFLGCILFIEPKQALSIVTTMIGGA